MKVMSPACQETILGYSRGDLRFAFHNFGMDNGECLFTRHSPSMYLRDMPSAKDIWKIMSHIVFMVTREFGGSLVVLRWTLIREIWDVQIRCDVYKWERGDE